MNIVEELRNDETRSFMCLSKEAQRIMKAHLDLVEWFNRDFFSWEKPHHKKMRYDAYRIICFPRTLLINEIET